MKTIADRVMDIIAQQLSYDRDKVTRADSLLDLEADSLDLVEIILEFEFEFDIELPDGTYEHLRTVGETIDLVIKTINASEARSEPPMIRDIAIAVDPNGLARLVFSFPMPRGTEDFKESIDEFVETVLRAAKPALQDLGANGVGRFEALILPDGRIAE